MLLGELKLLKDTNILKTTDNKTYKCYLHIIGRQTRFARMQFIIKQRIKFKVCQISFNIIINLPSGLQFTTSCFNTISTCSIV